jgi:hypothetical protein
MLQRLGKCPFCAGGKTLLDDPIVDQNDLCWLKISHTPVQNSAFHILVAPMRHRLSGDELTSSERDAMDEMLYRYLRSQGLSPGGVGLMREGPTDETGATVCHIHRNYIVAKKVGGIPQLITLVCGRWTGEPGWLIR